MTPAEVIWLVIFLVIILVLVIVIIVLARSHNTRPPTTSGYAVYPGYDGTELNTCGDSRDQACIYPAATLSDAVAQCNLLSCATFSYNSSTQSMKIIDTSNMFTNRLADVYHATDVTINTTDSTTPSS